MSSKRGLGAETGTWEVGRDISSIQSQKETTNREAKWDEAVLMDLLGTGHEPGSEARSWGLAHRRGAW